MFADAGSCQLGMAPSVSRTESEVDDSKPRVAVSEVAPPRSSDCILERVTANRCQLSIVRAR
ncbi:hypothetical protein ACQY0O_001813 [Thecaphora frezii]